MAEYGCARDMLVRIPGRAEDAGPIRKGLNGNDFECFDKTPVIGSHTAGGRDAGVRGTVF